MRKKIIVENIIKNLILILILVFSYRPIEVAVMKVSPVNLDSVIIFSSMALVAALFGNFTFTYEFSNVKSRYERMLAHVTTFLLMLAVGILLEMSTIYISIKAPSLFNVSALVLIIIYAATALYDFWDLFRSKQIRN
ncbi:hypothetical protein HYU11_06330 [Candidatus Woesearchaeota archaeon]|nr:hypothetical protein [Candidatus Woesearchaeota archaeon]